MIFLWMPRTRRERHLDRQFRRQRKAARARRRQARFERRVVRLRWVLLTTWKVLCWIGRMLRRVWVWLAAKARR